MVESGPITRSLARALLLATLLAFAPFAAAQDSRSAETPEEVSEVEESSSSNAREVDEITVVGTKSDVTNVQDEAAAITAFGMDDLDRAEIVNVDKLAFNVPSLHIGQTGSDSIITLRAVSTENATITGEPGIQFHVDGVNYARPSAARVAFFDLEGLQVLRGPQGFKGGKNATAGHISVSTAKPHGDFDTKFEYQIGNYNQRRSRGHVNIPINEYVQTRFAFLYEDRDGYQRNLSETLEFGDRRFQTPNSEDYDANDADDLGFRGHVKLLPTDSLEALLSYNYFQQDGVGPWNELQRLPTYDACSSLHPQSGDFLPEYQGLPSTLPPFYACRTKFTIEDGELVGSLKPDPALDNGTAARPNRVYKNRVSRQDNRFWGWSVNLDYEVPEIPLLGGTQLKSISGYQVTETFLDGDRDASEIDVFWGFVDKDSAQWTSELQWLGSSPEGLLDWQLSLFYLFEDSDSVVDVDARSGTIQRIYIGQEVENTSLGLALDTRWQVADSFSVNLGGRYIHDRRKTELLRSNSPALRNQLGTVGSSCRGPEDGAKEFPFDPFNPSPLGPPIYIEGGTPECQENFRQVIGSIGAEWRPLDALAWWPTDESLIYASASNGFKAGGFAAFEFGTYKPEKIWSFALGAKNSLFDDRLTLNLEGFFYNYRDMQLVVVDGLSVRTDNADTEMWGVEAEWEAEPLPGFRLNGMVSFLDTEFTDYLSWDPVDTRNAFVCKSLRPDLGDRRTCLDYQFKGRELPRAPKLTYSIGAEYDVFIGKFGTLTPRVQWYWQDDTWYRGFNRRLPNTGVGCCPILPIGASGDAPVEDLQNRYHFTDVKLVWTSPDDRYTFEAFLQNIEDNAVYQNVQIGSAFLSNPGFAFYGPPRTYGFRLAFRY